MKVLSRSRRDAAARKFALLALASLAPVVVAAVVPMVDVLRSVLSIVALCGYGYFGSRAMQCWQGRGQPSLRRLAWRRRFLDESGKSPAHPVDHGPFEEDCEPRIGASGSR